MRTRYVDEKGNPKYSNRLLHEQSPYLIQHGHNPVDWYPWGDEAFEIAEREGKPLFLSIGYATCHWCHVMERESFDNEEIAALLNSAFVPVKLDREQHPDIDDIYMSALQLMTGSGGWPISSFLTPDGRPFFAGTYFPPADFARLLERVIEVWGENRASLEESAGQVAQQVARYTSARAESVDLGDALPQEAARTLAAQLDGTLGGFGGAPKFPQEPRLELILDEIRRGDLAIPEALVTTLDRMAEGGIFDQVAGGFHRYSVDAEWQVPHFEKMLYNQAQAIAIYSTAYSLTRAWRLRRVVELTVSFLEREMQDPEGLFYSAIDADSEGEEGRFYVWTPAAMHEALSEEQYASAVELFGVTGAGNFEGSNVLHLAHPLAEVAGKRGVPIANLLGEVDAIRARLLEARAARDHPLVDRKVLAGWNGMTISALVHAADRLERGDYLAAATGAAERLWEVCWDDDEGLSRVWYEGRASVRGTLEDYSLFAQACLDLYDATAISEWLDRGIRLARRMIASFHAAEEGGFYLGHADGEGPLIARVKSPMDGASASANSSAVRLLIALFERTGELEYRSLALETVAAFSGMIRRAPEAFPAMLIGVGRLQGGSRERCQYAAGGRVRVLGQAREVEGRIEFDVELGITPGWHVAAHDCGGDRGVPFGVRSLVESARIAQIEYPESRSWRVPFEEEEWRIYSGVVVARGEIERAGEPGNALLSLAVTLQCCNDEFCTEVERLLLHIPVQS